MSQQYCYGLSDTGCIWAPYQSGRTEKAIAGLIQDMPGANEGSRPAALGMQATSVVSAPPRGQGSLLGL